MKHLKMYENLGFDVDVVNRFGYDILSKSDKGKEVFQFLEDKLGNLTPSKLKNRTFFRNLKGDTIFEISGLSNNIIHIRGKLIFKNMFRLFSFHNSMIEETIKWYVNTNYNLNIEIVKRASRYKMMMWTNINMKYLKTFETFNHKSIMESEDKVEYEYGCVMADVKFDNWQSILDSIDPDDLVDLKDHKKQLEDDPHITILYGLHDTVCEADVKELIQNMGTINVTLTDISIFENDDKPFDVIKYDVQSDDLNKMNKIISDNCEFTSDFPDYHPHITIAYTKKGKAKKYAKKLDPLITLELDTIIFSADGCKTKFKL